MTDQVAPLVVPEMEARHLAASRRERLFTAAWAQLIRVYGGNRDRNDLAEDAMHLTLAAEYALDRGR